MISKTDECHFGKSQAGIDIIRIYSGNPKEKKHTFRKAHSMYIDFRRGLRQLDESTNLSFDVAAKLVELWRNEFYERVHNTSFDIRVKKKLRDIFMLDTRELIVDFHSHNNDRNYEIRQADRERALVFLRERKEG